ncbi:hypothetical protein OIO90_004984 [Microbotryomycetes sp. JL221]|nr:hypothetical protein OIO90_004984 [Microbotryomycetes sp. JL221]
MSQRRSTTSEVDKVVVKRLHLSGLAPSVKPQDLAQRFASFGQVKGGPEAIGGLGLDGNGQPRTFAFLTLETTQRQLKKCMSMLSGSMWKGHKLKIAFAKPDYPRRLERERKQEALRLAAKEAAASMKSQANVTRKRSRKLGPNMAVLASRFEVVTPDNIQYHKGWTLDTTVENPIPLFPLLTRPPHPIEKPKKQTQTSWTRTKTTNKDLKSTNVETLIPLLRSRRMRIDPRKFGRKKILFDDKTVTTSSSVVGLRGVWECQIDQQDNENDLDEHGQTIVTWVFKGRDGQIKKKELVSLSRREAHSDRFASLLDKMEQSAEGHKETNDQTFGATWQHENHVDNSIDMSASNDGRDNEDATDRPKKRLKSASPPPYIPVAPRTLLYNDEDAFALAQVAQGDDEQAVSREKERQAHLQLLQSLLTQTTTATTQGDNLSTLKPPRTGDSKRLPQVEGFADDSDDDLTDLFSNAKTVNQDQSSTLRLRGGASKVDSIPDEESTDDTSESSSDDDSSSSADSSSEDDDDNKSDAIDKQADVEMQRVNEVESKSKTSVLAKGTLKDMFKAKEDEGSFSLLSGLDLELEPVERTPTPPPQRPPPPLPSIVAPVAAMGYRSQQLSAGTMTRQIGPLPPLFVFPSFEDDELTELGIDKAGMNSSLSSLRTHLENDARSFWRYESNDEIERNHQRLRDNLQGVARTRHREAVKRQHKNGKFTSLKIVGQTD